MSAALTKVVVTGFFFLCIFIFGFLLVRSGKPYSMILLNLHKLIALGALVFLVVTTVNVHRAASLTPAQMAAIVVAGVCFVATIITGGLVSIEKAMPAFVSVVHRYVPYLTLLATAASLYLLLGRTD